MTQRRARLWLDMSSAHETAVGFYAALGVKFDADAAAIKKAYHRKSLKWHPDRNSSEEAKVLFQDVNNAFACLSDGQKRKEYGTAFRMRCVLDQGMLTPQTLWERPLDELWMFAVQTPKGLGIKEDNVLLLNLEGGIAAGRLDLWRVGTVVRQYPLATLRQVDADSAGGAPTTLRLAFVQDVEPTAGSSARPSTSTLTLLARSVTEASTIAILLRALRAGAAGPDLGPRPTLRTDDERMPPVPRMVGMLTMRSSLAFVGDLVKSDFGRSSVFAMLGRSKLLLFSDALCSSLRQLIALEAGSLAVSHCAGEKEIELSISQVAGSTWVPSEPLRTRSCRQPPLGGWVIGRLESGGEGEDEEAHGGGHFPVGQVQIHPGRRVGFRGEAMGRVHHRGPGDGGHWPLGLVSRRGCTSGSARSARSARFASIAAATSRQVAQGLSMDPAAAVTRGVAGGCGAGGGAAAGAPTGAATGAARTAAGSPTAPTAPPTSDPFEPAGNGAAKPRTSSRKCWRALLTWVEVDSFGGFRLMRAGAPLSVGPKPPRPPARPVPRTYWATCERLTPTAPAHPDSWISRTKRPPAAARPEGCSLTCVTSTPPRPRKSTQT